MLVQDYDTTIRYAAKVLSSQRITPAMSQEDVREILIEVESQDFDAKVGQNIGVLPPGVNEFGERHHLRLYSVADLPHRTSNGHQQHSICVRRCHYVDPLNGKDYPGVASNYLCDLRPGDTLTVVGPYGLAFQVPSSHDATMILIGAGTGIAPFHAFVKHIYTHEPGYAGRVWLFHGAETGLDLLYRNEEKNDLALYYDRDTFEAFDALCKHPGSSDAIDWGQAMHSRGEQLCRLLSDPKTYVYIAGLTKISDELDEVLTGIAGSSQRWFQWKAKLQSENRWIEVLY